VAIGGGGGGGNEILAAGAAVRVRVDDSQVQQDLEKTNSKLKAFAKLAHKQGVGGVFGAAAGGGALGGFIGGMVAGQIQEMASAAADLALGLGKVRIAAQEAADALRLMLAERGRQLREIDEQIAAHVDRQARGSALKAEIERIRQEITELERATRELRGKSESQSSVFAGRNRGEKWGNFALWIRGQLEIQRGMTEGVTGAHAQMLEEARNRLAEKERELRRVLDPKQDPALIGELNQLTESLKQQVSEFGLPQHWAAINRFTERGLDTSKAQEHAENLDRLTAEQEEAEKTAAAVAALMDRVKTPIERFMEEIEEMSRLFEQGAIDADLFTRAKEDAEKRLAEATKPEMPNLQSAASGSFALTAGQFGGPVWKAIPGKLDTIAGHLRHGNEIAEQTLEVMASSTFTFK
jgi:hypothetical protein